MIRLYIDGPFGSPSEEVFNYDVSLCVAGGIGVTPFACVLHALLWVVGIKKILCKHQMFTSVNVSIFLALVVHPVMAGGTSSYRGCTLCGSAGSFSRSTGLQSCYVPFINRSGPSLFSCFLKMQLDHNLINLTSGVVESRGRSGLIWLIIIKCCGECESQDLVTIKPQLIQQY